VCALNTGLASPNPGGFSLSLSLSLCRGVGVGVGVRTRCRCLMAPPHNGSNLAAPQLEGGAVRCGSTPICRPLHNWLQGQPAPNSACCKGTACTPLAAASRSGVLQELLCSCCDEVP
jgi:hypothetical protein